MESHSIRLIKRKDIDDKLWDQCISEAKNSLIYGYSWYLDIVCDGWWEALVQGDYQAVMPLPYNDKYVLYRQIYPPFYCQQLGPFFREKINLQEFLLPLQKRYKKIAYPLNYHFGGDHHLSEVFEISERKNYVLKVEGDYFAKFSKTTRANIRKNFDSHIYEDSAENIDHFFTHYSRFITNKPANIGDDEITILYKLAKKALQRDKAKIYLAYLDHDLVAGALIMVNNNRHTLLADFLNDQGKKTRSGYCLKYFIYKSIENQDCIFDFEGSNIPSIEKYILQFGAKAQNYALLQQNLLPQPIRRIEKIIR